MSAAITGTIGVHNKAEVLTTHSTLLPCDSPFASPCQSTCVLLIDFARSHSLPRAFDPVRLAVSAMQRALLEQCRLPRLQAQTTNCTHHIPFDSLFVGVYVPALHSVSHNDAQRSSQGSVVVRRGSRLARCWDVAGRDSGCWACVSVDACKAHSNAAASCHRSG